MAEQTLGGTSPEDRMASGPATVDTTRSRSVAPVDEVIGDLLSVKSSLFPGHGLRA